MRFLSNRLSGNIFNQKRFNQQNFNHKLCLLPKLLNLEMISGVVKLIDIFIPDMPDSVQLRIDIDEIIANDILNDDESIKKKVSSFHL